MANLTPLRNIHLSGGLFTENLLLKIRDKKDKVPEVHFSTFGENGQEEKKRYHDAWDWAKRLFGEIANKIDTWTIEERFEKWIKPLLQKLRHECLVKPSINLTMLSEEEQDNILNKIQVSHQIKNHAKIGLHVCEDDNFDERNDTNYQKKSQHDHFQRFILLNEGVRWGLLSNGKYIRLLGEYSNIYAKGYIQFNLDSIFVKKDESEFWVFYALIHHSRFSETYGLNPDEWIKKLEAKWKKSSAKLTKIGIEIEIDLISEDILGIYKNILIDLINKAENEGVIAVKTSDSEVFMENLLKEGLDLGEIGRDFYLKELDSIISNINENLSIIQRLQKRSQEEGIEAGKKLRENVRKALELMGESLINSSKVFIDDIFKGNVEIKDFYQELLRITYRIIFILYAEAKELLPGVATIYYNELGLTYLRKKAQQPIRDDQNNDLWYRLLLLFEYLNIGEKSLGINAFSGELFNPEGIPLIVDKNYGLSIPNSKLLKILFDLTIVDLGIGLQPINYSEIGEEEIGSIYEALLDFQPRYRKKDTPTYHFLLDEIDTERKGSGTYYTPKGLIDILLKTALKPVVENKLDGLENKKDKLEALLDLKICDPACGGGSFLLASIDYLGKIYAQIETDQDFPEEKVLRKSRRIILQSCIYGVDLNPMALELAKVSLWLKASVKNKPLTFLNNHLKLGNSLIGFSKKQKINKISKKAFNSVKGKANTGIPDESQKLLNEALKHLQRFSISDITTGKSLIQKTLIPYKDSDEYSEIATGVFSMKEDNFFELQEKIKCYSKLHNSNSWRNLNLQANLWHSSFFWNFGENYNPNIPTDVLIFNLKHGNLKELDKTIHEVDDLSKFYNFFNWYLEFPEVFQKENPGFDCLLMNPPWEVLKFNEMEFFANKSDIIVDTQNQAKRQKEIKKLKDADPDLQQDYIKSFRKMKKETYYYKNSNLYNLSSVGIINYFALFIERARNLINEKGKIGVIVQSTFLTGSFFSKFFRDILDSNSLEVAFDFINRHQIFPLHTYTQFSLLTLSSPKKKSRDILMAFQTWSIEKLKKSLENLENQVKDELKRKTMEGGEIIHFKNEDFKMFNPNSRTSPSFKTIEDFILSKKAYEKVPILVKREKKKILKDYWNINIDIHFQVAQDSHLFSTYRQLKQIGIAEEKKGGIQGTLDGEIYLPLYGGSSIWFYDSRYNEIKPKKDKSKKRKADYIKVSENLHQDPNYEHIPMYWIKQSDAIEKFPKIWDHDWFLGFRDISSSNLQRSFVISALPKYPALATLRIITFKYFRKEILCFLANLSSIPFDFLARNKISGQHFAQYIVEQIPVFPPRAYNNDLFEEIKKRILELVFTSWDMISFAQDFIKSKDLKPYKWSTERREILKAELDAIFAMMYGYTYDELNYILNSFDILRKNELRELGEFRTKRLVLNSYEKLHSDQKLGPLFRLEGVDLEKLKGE